MLSLRTCPRILGFVSVAGIGQLSPANSQCDHGSFTCAHAATMADRVRISGRRTRTKWPVYLQAQLLRRATPRSALDPELASSSCLATGARRLSCVLVPPFVWLVARSQIHYGLEGYLGRRCTSRSAETKNQIGTDFSEYPRHLIYRLDWSIIRCADLSIRFRIQSTVTTIQHF